MTIFDLRDISFVAEPGEEVRIALRNGTVYGRFMLSENRILDGLKCCDPTPEGDLDA